MEKIVNKAHELIIIVRELLFKEYETSCLVKDFVSELLMTEYYENINIVNVIEIFKLNESNEPCIKLELAHSKQSLLQMVDKIIKIKNPDRLQE